MRQKAREKRPAKREKPQESRVYKITISNDEERKQRLTQLYDTELKT